MSAETKTNKSENNANTGYSLSERFHGKFSRTIQLPQGVQVCPSFHSLLNECFVNELSMHRMKKSKRRWKMVYWLSPSHWQRACMKSHQRRLSSRHHQKKKRISIRSSTFEIHFPISTDNILFCTFILSSSYHFRTCMYNWITNLMKQSKLTLM